MVRELFYIPYIVSIPGLMFVISILLFLFVSASAGSYIPLPLVATLHISRVTSVLHEINS
jgi:hypothetical protein